MPFKIVFRSLLFIVFLLPTQWVSADTIPTFLYGNDTAYKNAIIKATCLSDYISKTPQIVGVDTVNANGDFKIILNLTETKLVSLDLGLYEGVLYIEPGTQYEIVLPDYEPKTMGEVLNPFFQPTQIFLGIKNVKDQDLNYLIADFDFVYQEHLERNYYRLFKAPVKSDVDSIVMAINANFDSIENDYYNMYRYYKLSWLRYMSYMRDYRYIIREMYNDKPVGYYNVAYMDLFNQVFNNYFTFYANTSEGARIYSDVAYAKSPKYIGESLENTMVLSNDTLKELVMLKGLHDAYYSRDFPEKSLTITLDSIAALTTIEHHRQIAENIKAKVFKARQGQPVPPFDLRDSKGIYRKSSDFLANYIYLNFCSVESFTCQQDFELLKMLHNKHKGEFRIISICIDDDFNKAREYFKENGYEWMLLSCKDQMSLIDDFKVKAYPTYFLVNPKGKLNMSPASGPSENFEWHFFKTLQAKKRETNH